MAASRKIDTAQFRTIVDSLYGMIPEQGLKYKLADKLIQKSEYDDLLKTKLNLKEKKS
jgi:protease-4